MTTIEKTLFWWTFKLLWGASGVLYAVLVLMSYATEGRRYRLQLELENPARSAASLLIWLGVKAVAAILSVGRSVLEILSETSADVGEWFIRRRGPEVDAMFRSRFL